MKKQLSLTQVLKERGDNVYFAELTNELLTLALKPGKNKVYKIYCEFEGKKLYLGPMTYIGQL
jgi:hypothetical protein